MRNLPTLGRYIGSALLTATLALLATTASAQPARTVTLEPTRVTRGVSFTQTNAIYSMASITLQPGTKLDAPPPPPVPGWPHTILSGTATACARDPLPNEVIIASDPGFSGRCASLKPGFYPERLNAGIGADQFSGVSSIKVGSAVRARAFRKRVYGDQWTVYPANTRAAGLGTFNDRIESWRIEPAGRSLTCNDLREGEIALYELENFLGDCVVLPGDESYPNASLMGIEGDSISSMRNQSTQRLLAFWHSNFNLLGAIVEPHAEIGWLSHGSWNTDGIDNDILSIQMSP